MLRLMLSETRIGAEEPTQPFLLRQQANRKGLLAMQPACSAAKHGGIMLQGRLAVCKQGGRTHPAPAACDSVGAEVTLRKGCTVTVIGT